MKSREILFWLILAFLLLATQLLPFEHGPVGAVGRSGPEAHFRLTPLSSSPAAKPTPQMREGGFLLRPPHQGDFSPGGMGISATFSTMETAS